MKNLNHVKGRIICKVDLEQKNYYTLTGGVTIRLERDFDNFDRKYTQQVLGLVVSAKDIPTDALVLFHHNSLHESYKIHDQSTLTDEEIKSGIKLFSILERDCFFWKMSGEEEWNATRGYEKALRVFVPYEGGLSGIKPKMLTDTLYVLTGDLAGQVVHTAKASDYEITFRNEKGVDEKIIRFRPHGIPEEGREEEAIAVLHGDTEMVKNGIYLVGTCVSDAKNIL